MAAPAGEARLHAAVCRSNADRAEIVCEIRLPADRDLVLGADPSASFVVPDWTGPPVLIVSGDGFLHLGPGMRVNMCGDDGRGRVVGTYEELLAKGVNLPIPIMKRRLNVRVRDGLSVFGKYVDAQGEELRSELEGLKSS